MNEFNRLASDPYSIAAIVGAVVFKVATDVKITARNVVVTVCAAFFTGLFFGAAMIEYLEISSVPISAAVYIAAAITGEHLMRLAIGFAQDPRKAIELWRELRYGGKNVSK